MKTLQDYLQEAKIRTHQNDGEVIDDGTLEWLRKGAVTAMLNDHAKKLEELDQAINKLK